MDLFVINRYTGDQPPTDEISKEELLRQKLLKKIRKRKRLNELSLEEQNDFSHKKRKSDVLEDLAEKIPNANLDLPNNEKQFTHTNNRPENEEHSYIKSQNVDAFYDETNVVKKKKKKKEFEDKSRSPDNGEVVQQDTDKELLGNETQDPGFTLLGDVHMSKKEKVKRKLPNWLANPSVVSVNLKYLKSKIDSIPELNKTFLDKLKENCITHFFPVQSQIIPWLLRNAQRPRMYRPNDICVSAPTGSGKTLAFVLPILQILYKRIVPKIRALVVLPVQDLANQVFSVFETYSKSTNLKVLLLSKKRRFEEEQSLICRNDGIEQYRTLVDIIVTTPGRLVDHLTKTKGLCLNSLRYLIIDEADRVMENVQNDWLYHLNKHMNSECIRSYQIPVISYSNLIEKNRAPNKLLFSATLSQDPEKLQHLGLFQPKLFTSVVNTKTLTENGHPDDSKFLGKYTTPAELTEYYINSTKASKPLILHYLLKSKSWKNVLCFVNSAEATSRLAFVLKFLGQKDTKIGKLSASLNIKKRDLLLKKFYNGEINVLVCSDALARGIDIPNVQFVISYDAPKYIKTYIHRIGRTGRAGREGTSVVLLTSKEKNNFQKMVETAGKTSVKELNIDEEELVEYQRPYEEALQLLGTVLEKRKQKSISKLNTKKLSKQTIKGKFKINKKCIKKIKIEKCSKSG